VSEPVCVVVGVGPGNGASIARRFAREGYRVAMTARSEERLRAFEREIPGSRGYVQDVREVEAAAPLFARIREELGPPSVLVYNAGSASFGSVDDVDLEAFQTAWEVNVRGLFVAAKQALDDLRAAGGALVVVGATASVKGGARFAAFASAKFGQRGLAQSLARHLGPQGVHVGYVVIDGVIDIPRTRKMMPDKPDEFFLQADRIADAVLFLAQQDPSAWSFELDLRPFAESW
jgi:NAD(P)-dependent dehydrogenase (short-subunit alcohol dehydrogenase family)